MFPEFLDREVAVPVLVEEFESLLEVVLEGDGLHSMTHHLDELVKLYGTVPVGVRLADDGRDFHVGRVVPERPDDLAELLDGYGAVAVGVELRDGLLDPGELRF